jgi:5-methylcytosine-specific restriction enzyme subunit McrC
MLELMKKSSQNDYLMSGNRISVKTLDLNQDFDVIKKQLNSIVEDYLKAC